MYVLNGGWPWVLVACQIQRRHKWLNAQALAVIIAKFFQFAIRWLSNTCGAFALTSCSNSPSTEGSLHFPYRTFTRIPGKFSIILEMELLLKVTIACFVTLRLRLTTIYNRWLPAWVLACQIHLNQPRRIKAQRI
jgi:hypothetical protein